MYYSRLTGIISSYIDLYPQDIDLIKSFFHYDSVPKGSSLIEFGAKVEKTFFILSGYLKYFKLAESGDEIIIHLYAPDSFATSLNGFFLGKRSEEALQAITDCRFLSVSKSDLEKLYAAGCKWQVFGRKLMESFLIEKEERIIDQLSLTARERYLKLVNNQPAVVQNVPVKHIASHIGVQPESLSRIRKMK